MSTRINGTRLRELMAIRGLSAADLSALAQLSAATTSHALNDRPITNRTLAKLAKALAAAAPIPGAEELVA